jgi:1-acyl-sn-glycerol-3-phosphate acyltransferase
MNRQPYCRPPKWWEPKISPWWVRMSAPVRRRQLLSKQRITGVEADNLEVLRRELGQGRGVLIVANHSAHYDSAALYLAADQIHLPLYFMTAWQVFAMSSRFECWAMQRLGCFSVDRESTDRQAFKQAVQILQDAPYPLVIFPEGDIYHTSDCVTPFREGAAAVALAAAKRGARRQVVVPCGIKFWYAEDPTHDLLGIAATLEQRLYLRTQPQQTLPTRIHRLAEAALALKELDYLGHTREGRLRERVVFLTNAVLEQLEQRHAVRAAAPATAPERVKTLRQTVIRRLEELQSGQTEKTENTEKTEFRSQASASNKAEEIAGLQADMEDLFFAMQLFSYRGDYLVDSPSIERLAETLDKFEEDILQRDLPTVRGRRRVQIQFGEPLEVDGESRGRDRTAVLTSVMQDNVQRLIDQMNARESMRRGGGRSDSRSEESRA